MSKLSELKGYLVFCLLVFSLSGCGCQEPDNTAKQIGEISLVSLLYYNHNNKWPNSIEELESFCLQNKEECLPLDWNKHVDTHFETLPDESLKIEFYAVEEPNKYISGQKPNIVLTIGKPTIQQNSSNIENSGK